MEDAPLIAQVSHAERAWRGLKSPTSLVSLLMPQTSMVVDPGPRRAYVLGGSLGRPSLEGWVSAGALALLVALPLRGLYRGTGSSMEEGFMLVFPMRMLVGDVPNVDFLHLYGPGSLHTLMGWYHLFGATLESQRTFGFLQHLGIITAIFALARPWGHRIALIAATVVTFLVLTPIGLSALAWEGAVALGLWSVVVGLRAGHTGGRGRTAALLGAGALAGFALSFRPDLVIAIGLAHLVVMWRTRSWRLLFAGAVIGATPMWVHLAVAGIGPSWRGMVIEPVRDLRPGRELPRPPSWSKIDGALQAVAEGPADAPWWRIPSLSANHQLFIWFWVVILLCIIVPLGTWWLARRRGWSPMTVVLLASGLFGLGLIGQAMQRPDSTHLAWGSCVSFAMAVPLLREAVGRWQPRRSTLQIDLAIGVVAALTLLVVCPYYTYRYYLFYSRISIGQKQGGFEVERDGRRFYFGNEALQRASQAAIDQLEAVSDEGDRLLVGPADLSRTIYSDAVFYYLFPELVPATYFIEMDPGLADRPGSGLAEDVASADFLLLTNFWTGWYEPNASTEFGSDEPNQVVAAQFCIIGNFDNALVLLYERCEQGDGISPAGIGIGAERRADLERELAEAGG